MSDDQPSRVLDDRRERRRYVHSVESGDAVDGGYLAVDDAGYLDGEFSGE